MLTIEKNGLGRVWLPSYRDELEAVKWLEKHRPRNIQTKNWEDWHQAYRTCKRTLEATVDHIVKRGGLLLLVPA